MTSEELSQTETRLSFVTVRPVWVTNWRRSAVIAMLGSSLRKLQFRPGMDGLCCSTKQAGLSFAPARTRVGPNTCFSTAATTVAAAAAAAAAACFCCGCLCCCCCRCCCCCYCTTYCSLVLLGVFFFDSNSSAKAIPGMEVDVVVEKSQKSNVYEYEKKTCT